ncbi:MAG: hypothetical protein A2066_00600 [Bacteroidetes bacterium GWB2_41_8]|nr:MAG: hypothetical protein A2066_00600 [Bacteroidetes bacterium GWB2_41_8]
MELELVSILIPVYNRVSLVGETIESAINQTYKNIEIIIVDNCSTDGTWDLLKYYAEQDRRIRIFKNNENIGPVRNWKRCLDKAKGKYSKILWSDDTIDKNFIEKTITKFDDNTAFVMTGFLLFDSEAIVKRSFFQVNTVIDKNIYFNNILFDNKQQFPVSPGNAIFRTIDLMTAYTESTEIKELKYDFLKSGAGTDLFFFLLTAQKYNNIRCHNEILSFYRMHTNSISETNRLEILYSYEICKISFILNYKPELLSIKKSDILLKSINLKHLRNLTDLIDTKYSLIYILKKVWKKLQLNSQS